MRIVHLAAEFAPIAKAGGLGEVIVGLCRELGRLGEEVQVILPKYDFIDPAKLPNLKLEVADFKCLGYNNAMWVTKVEGCHLHLLEARHPAGYFHRGKIYGLEDDISRFLYFSRAALEYLRMKKEPIDILHLHDWHVSICAPLAKEIFKDLKVKAIALSLHNTEYQGKCAPADLDAIGMKGSEYLTKDKLQDNNPKYPQTINLLKGGIVYSDAIIPVSPTYAEEILTPEYGFNLDATLRKYKTKMQGILNGIDQTLWDPSLDPHLAAHYAVESVQKGKKLNREALAKKYKLNASKRPWVGAVTRLVPQKGPELLEEALKKTIDSGGTFLLLGSSPIAKLQDHFRHLKETYEKSNQVFIESEYNEPLAHFIYSALDLVAVPSHFEPCGLTQLIGMRYGTVPLVRATGGLKDTVFDCENSKIPVEQRNGFTFKEPTSSSIRATLERAFQLFKKDPSTFHSLIRHGMESDFSWKKPAQEYLKIYRRLLRPSSLHEKVGNL